MNQDWVQRLKLADELLQKWDRCACQSPDEEPRLCLGPKQHTDPNHDWPDAARITRIIPF